jgi:hypothetical protein
MGEPEDAVLDDPLQRMPRAGGAKRIAFAQPRETDSRGGGAGGAAGPSTSTSYARVVTEISAGPAAPQAVERGEFFGELMR